MKSDRATEEAEHPVDLGRRLLEALDTEEIGEARALLVRLAERIGVDQGCHAWLTRMRDLCEDRRHPTWISIDWLIGDLERRPSFAPEHDRRAGLAEREESRA